MTAKQNSGSSRAVGGTDPDRQRRDSRVRPLLVGGGVLVMGYAVTGALTDSDARRVGVVVFLAAVVVGHDAVFLPLVIGVGALIRRFAPARVRGTVQVAALVSLAVGVVGTPLALGYGRPADNPSALPLPYARNLIVLLIGIWVGAFVIRKGLARRRARRSR